MADRLNDNPWTSPEHRQLDTHNIEQHSLQVTDSARPNYNLITGKCTTVLTGFTDSFVATQTGAGSTAIVSGASTSLTGQTVSLFCAKTMTVSQDTGAGTVTITSEPTADADGSGTVIWQATLAIGENIVVPLGFGASFKAGDIFHTSVDHKLSVTNDGGNTTVTLSGVSTF